MQRQHTDIEEEIFVLLSQTVAVNHNVLLNLPDKIRVKNSISTS